MCWRRGDDALDMREASGGLGDRHRLADRVVARRWRLLTRKQCQPARFVEQLVRLAKNAPTRVVQRQLFGQAVRDRCSRPFTPKRLVARVEVIMRTRKSRMRVNSAVITRL